MNHEQQLKLFYEVKSSILIMMQNVFNAIDHELEKHITTHDDKKYIKASSARLAVKGLRTLTLEQLKSMQAPSASKEDLNE